MSTVTDRRPPMNGVDVPTLFATLDAVRGAPEAARFTFRASNRWEGGTHSRTTIHAFHGVGQEQQHRQAFELEGDHPEVLVGQDHAPTPVEAVLHALAACLTAGIGNIASARGVRLTSVTSELEGEIDLRGLLGLADDVRNGFQRIRVRFAIDGDATEEQLRGIVEQSKARSAVLDLLTNGTDVEVAVDAA